MKSETKMKGSLAIRALEFVSGLPLMRRGPLFCPC